jgi:hypothetical protein
MMTRQISHALLVLAVCSVAVGTSGCFGVHDVDQGPWVIDDFEDGDLNPADPNFGPWTCSSFNETTSDNCSAGLDVGYQSAYSLFLDFAVDDPLDGTQERGGAELYTGATRPENLSAYGEMVLNAKLVSDVPSLPGGATLDAQLGCSTVEADDGTFPGTLYVVQGLIGYSADWQTFTLPTENFGSPPWIATKVVGGPTACLERVDSISFEFDPNLPDGQSVTARLNVDDIYFQ